MEHQELENMGYKKNSLKFEFSFFSKNIFSMDFFQRIALLLDDDRKEIEIFKIYQYVGNETIYYFEFLTDYELRFNYIKIGNDDSMINYLPKDRSEEEPWNSRLRINIGLGRFIQNLFSYINIERKKDNKEIVSVLPKEIEKWVNQYKAYYLENKLTFSIVRGEEIRKWYLEDCYNTNEDDGSTLGNSCMRYRECQKFFNIYCENNNVEMLILVNGDKKLEGRALLWKKEDGSIFMDRIYYSKDSIIQLFLKEAESKNYIPKDINSNKEIPGLQIKLEKTEFEYYPYLDTLPYLSENYLYSYKKDLNGKKAKYLKNTDGKFYFINFSQLYEKLISGEDITQEIIEKNGFILNQKYYCVINDNVKNIFYSSFNEQLIVYKDIDVNIQHLDKNDVFIDNLTYDSIPSMFLKIRKLYKDKFIKSMTTSFNSNNKICDSYDFYQLEEICHTKLKELKSELISSLNNDEKNKILLYNLNKISGDVIERKGNLLVEINKSMINTFFETHSEDISDLNEIILRKLNMKLYLDDKNKVKLLYNFLKWLESI